MSVATTDLATVLQVAHHAGVTVNDLLLAAIGGTIGTVMSARGESLDHIVVSVPVSLRGTANPLRLGNAVGVLPVTVRTRGGLLDRVTVIAAQTMAGRATVRSGASATLLTVAFRLLAHLGAFRWFVDRQRLVNTFVSNLRGPTHELTFAGVGVTDLLTLPAIVGNVPVAFSVVSCAGQVTVTIVCDPDRFPDLSGLTHTLQHQIDELPTVARMAAPGQSHRWECGI